VPSVGARAGTEVQADDQAGGEQDQAGDEEEAVDYDEELKEFVWRVWQHTKRRQP